MLLPRSAPLVAALAALCGLATAARADDEAPVTKPMTSVADGKAVCALLLKDVPGKPTCKSVAKAALAGGATAELYATSGSDLFHFAVAVTVDGKTSVSTVVEVVGEDCGMGKCDLLDGKTPALRAAAKGAMVVMTLDSKFHHEATVGDEGKREVTERWTEVDVVACGKNGGGALVCNARHRGGRGHACSAKAAADGTLKTTCVDAETLTLD